MHKKIELKASKALKEDSLHYHKKVKTAKSPKKKMQARIEEKEAGAAARDLKRRAKSAHEY